MIYRSVELSAEGCALIEELSARRHANNRAAGSYDKIADEMGQEAAFKIERKGLGAELAFCEMFKIPNDPVVSDERLDYDVELPDGRTVDVKSSTLSYSGLIADVDKVDRPPDLYALVICQHPHYRFAGVMAAGKLLQEWRITNRFRFGPVYFAEQRELENLRL